LKAAEGRNNRYLESETMQRLSQTHIQSPASFEMQRHAQFSRQVAGGDHNHNHNPTLNYQVGATALTIYAHVCLDKKKKKKRN